MRISFVVPGNPIPWKRPQFKRDGKTYVDKRTQAAKLCVMAAARRSGIRKPLTGPVHLSVTFWRQTAHVCDIDNLAKLVQDALNGFAYVDDRQIEMLTAAKAIDRQNPRTLVEIEELPAAGTPLLVDEMADPDERGTR